MFECLEKFLQIVKNDSLLFKTLLDGEFLLYDIDNNSLFKYNFLFFPLKFCKLKVSSTWFIVTNGGARAKRWVTIRLFEINIFCFTLYQHVHQDFLLILMCLLDCLIQSLLTLIIELILLSGYFL